MYLQVGAVGGEVKVIPGSPYLMPAGAAWPFLFSGKGCWITRHRTPHRRRSGDKFKVINQNGCCQDFISSREKGTGMYDGRK